MKSAQTLKRFFDSYHIKSEILQCSKNRGNLLVRIPGTEPHAPSLMYMSHMDVVPAIADDWSCDPFAADERGGYIWGRGALDMLNITASSACAFADCIKAHKQFPGDFIYLAVADEEASGRLGARWLVENHWDKVKTNYMITEGGGFFLHNKQKVGITLSIGEKGMAWTKLTAEGIPGHGSLPYMADNAAIKLAHGVVKIHLYPNKTRITKEFREMVNKLGLSSIVRAMLVHPVTVKKALKGIYRISPGLAKHLHAISRITISPNMIKAGNKVNIIPNRGEVDLDIRILPGQTVEDVIRHIKTALGAFHKNFTIEVVDFFPANISPGNTTLFSATEEILNSIYPGISCIPTLFSGVTDARFWRMRGSVAYGFAMFDDRMTLDEYIRMLHGKDERVSIKSMELSYNYFRTLPEVFFRKAAQDDYS